MDALVDMTRLKMRGCTGSRAEYVSGLEAADAALIFRDRGIAAFQCLLVELYESTRFLDASPTQIPWYAQYD